MHTKNWLEDLGKWSLGKSRSRKEDSTMMGVEEYGPEECRWENIYEVGSCHGGRYQEYCLPATSIYRVMGPENGRSMFLKNVDIHLRAYTASHSKIS
jgi:hypothetical protein